MTNERCRLNSIVIQFFYTHSKKNTLDHTAEGLLSDVSVPHIVKRICVGNVSAPYIVKRYELLAPLYYMQSVVKCKHITNNSSYPFDKNLH